MSTVALALALLASAVSADAMPAQGSPPMCAIDMGSNSFRRIVATFGEARYLQRNIEVRTLGVGDDVARHGRISDAKLGEIATVLAAFKVSCDKEGAMPVVAVGTAAFRQAPNGKQVVEVAAKLGIAMEIASEARESELAYLVGSLGRDDRAVIDNGSRSIELVARRDGVLRHHVFNQGYRAAYETFFAGATDAAAAVLSYRTELRQHAAKAMFMKGASALIGVEFGEMVTVLFGSGEVEGRVFAVAELQQKLNEISKLTAAGFQALKQRKEIDRALPRLVVAATLAADFGDRQIQLTERELGAGLIIEAGTRPAGKK